MSKVLKDGDSLQFTKGEGIVLKRSNGTADSIGEQIGNLFYCLWDVEVMALLKDLQANAIIAKCANSNSYMNGTLELAI